MSCRCADSVAAHGFSAVPVVHSSYALGYRTIASPAGDLSGARAAACAGLRLGRRGPRRGARSPNSMAAMCCPVAGLIFLVGWDWLSRSGIRRGVGRTESCSSG